MVTHHQGSKGPVAIDSMAFPHLKSALAKLLANRVGEERQDEVDAMSKRLEVLEAEHAAKTEGAGANAEPDEAALRAENELAFIAIDDARNAAEDANPRAVIGGNAPPENTPYEALKAHMDDLLVEARNWADGVAVETQAQADEINRLKDDLLKAAQAAESRRVKEKKPYDDAIAEIQDRYNAYIAPKQNKKPGKITLALQALAAALTPYLQKIEDAQRAQAAEARRLADEKAAAAAAAVRQTEASDLSAREAAEALVTEAAQAAAAAKRAEAAKAHAQGGVKATGLRSFWSAVMTDRKAALIHYLTTQPDVVQAFIQQLADKDVQAGRRAIPGFDVIEERRAA